MRGLVLGVLLALSIVANPAAAQVVLDGSVAPLPETGPLVPLTSASEGGPLNTYEIRESYGRRSGPNLFHSFARFDVPAAQSALFTRDPFSEGAIERVIGRVTGGDHSEIGGALRSTIEGADLYLINPRGFTFSGAPRLDLRGSFYLSSADNLRFEDDLVYSTIPSSGEVLSEADPSAWGFTSESPLRTIRFNQVRNFRVPDGETLEVVGGPVLVRGEARTTTLAAPGGTIALASRMAPGEVPVDIAQLAARGALPDEFGSVSVGGNALLDVSDTSNLAPERGRIVIRGETLALTGSELRSDSVMDSADAAPDVDLETRTSISLGSASRVAVTARGAARGGGARISSGTITFTGASYAESAAAGAALAGPLDVEAGALVLSGISHLSTSAAGDATAGRISIDATSIDLTTGAQVSSVNAASTDAPDVEITVAELLKIGSGALLVTQAAAGGRGAALRIGAATLEQSIGARIESDTFGTGVGGDIEIDAGVIDLRGDPLGADPGGVIATSLGSGAAGDISIRADDVDVAGGAQVSASAQAAGRGGDIEISASRTLELMGRTSIGGASGVFARSGLGVGTTATGDGGGIEIEAPVVVVNDGAEISTQTFGVGAAGDIRIVSTERVALAGRELVTSSINAKAAVGNGGGIAIETAELRVDDGGEISASTLASGDSGDIEIEAERVYVGGGAASDAAPAGIFAQSIPTEDEGPGGDGGDIEIRASSLVELQNGAVISAKTRGSGDAGKVLIVAPVVNVTDGAEISTQTFASGAAGGVELVAAERVGIAGGATTRSRINAQAARGQGGSIDIETAELRVDDGGEISASALGTGDSGDIEIEAERVYVGGGATSAAGAARISAQSTPTAESGIEGGDGGDIEIRASSLVELSNGGAISVETRGAGAAGEVSILDAQSVSLVDGSISGQSDGSGAAGSVKLTNVGALFVWQGGSITTETRGDGIGGSIDIGARSQVMVANGGRISASSTGSKDAGSIAIDAGERFSARNGGQVTTSAAFADGGDILIAATRFIYVQNSTISTNVTLENGNGGNITLDPEFTVLNEAVVTASARGGDGGNIRIPIGLVVRDAASVVTATSELGIDGEILISSPVVDLTSELVQLDATYLDASSKLAAACAARAGERGTFAVRGGSRPVSPESPLGSTGDETRAPGCDEPVR